MNFGAIYADLRRLLFAFEAPESGFELNSFEFSPVF